MSFSEIAGRSEGIIDIKAIIFSILLSLIIALCVYLFWPSDVEVGLVEYKQVDGINGRIVTTLIHQNENELKFENFNLEKQADGQFIIDDSMEKGISDGYEKIRYLTAIRLCKNDELNIFYASRNDFNLLKPGILAKFKIDKSAGNYISELHEY